MPKQIYQTEIHIFHGGKGSVTITRRHNETRQYDERQYQPTKASWQRLNKTVSEWVNKNMADINLINNSIFIEPTI